MPKQLVITDPNPKTRSRWTELSATITDPGEPPHRGDAMQNLYLEWYETDDDSDPPDAKAIDAELERIQELYRQGVWERP